MSLAQQPNDTMQYQHNNIEPNQLLHLAFNHGPCKVFLQTGSFTKSNTPSTVKNTSKATLKTTALQWAPQAKVVVPAALGLGIAFYGAASGPLGGVRCEDRCPKTHGHSQQICIPRSTAPALSGIIMPVPSLRRNLPPDGFFRFLLRHFF